MHPGIATNILETLHSLQSCSLSQRIQFLSTLQRMIMMGMMIEEDNEDGDEDDKYDDEWITAINCKVNFASFLKLHL